MSQGRAINGICLCLTCRKFNISSIIGDVSALSTKLLKSKMTYMRASFVTQGSLGTHPDTKLYYLAENHLLAVALSISLHFGPSKFHGLAVCLF